MVPITSELKVQLDDYARGMVNPRMTAKVGCSCQTEAAMAESNSPEASWTY